MIAITGHTSGIGKYIYDRLELTHGYSRSTGYDITSRTDRARIIEDSKDCTIFINCAHCEMGQALLLIDIERAWRDTNKTVISIGSKIADPGVILPASRIGLLEYQTYKIGLKHVHFNLTRISNLRMLYRSFGYVGTAHILSKYPHFTYPNDYITLEDAFREIFYNSDI